MREDAVDAFWHRDEGHDAHRLAAGLAKMSGWELEDS